jgi:ubiquinone/menaquinone biosynthesis C-methylase UbiE
MLSRRTREGIAPTGRWEAHAADWIRWAREPGHDSYWRFHRDAFLPLIPAAPRRLLDLGCGEGRLSRDLRAAGHDVVGVDASHSMIQAAREVDPAGTYLVADAAHLPFGDAEFDDVIAFMSLHDMDDFKGAVAEATRVMTPQGHLCVAVVHPINSAGFFDSEEPHARFTIDESYLDTWDYTETIEREGLRMTFSSVHRPLGVYVEQLSSNGLVIDRLGEVGEDPESVLAAPRRLRWTRMPLFLHLRARRC